MLSISLIDESTTNPRVSSWGNLDELAASIKSHGVVQAVVVRKHPTEQGRFELVLGARRLRASTIAGINSIPAHVRRLDDRQVLELQIIENSHREDVSPIEEGRAFSALVERYGLRAGEIADKIGRGHAYVNGRLRLAEAVDEVRALLEKGTIGLGGALAIAQLAPEQQREVARRVTYRMSKQEVVRLIYSASRALRSAPWSLDDETLVDGATACSRCPRTSTAQAEIFTEPNHAGATCLDGDCWARKLLAYTQNAREQELTLIEGEEAEEQMSFGQVSWNSRYVDASEFAPVEVEWPREAELVDLEELLDRTDDDEDLAAEYDRTLDLVQALRQERREWVEANRVTWAEVADRAGVRPALLVGADAVRPVLERDAQAELLDNAGYTKAADMLRERAAIAARAESASQDLDPKAEARRKKRQAAALEKLVEKIVNMAAVGLAAEGSYAANLALVELWSRRVERDLAIWICKRRGIAREGTTHPADCLREYAATLTSAGQLRGLLVEMSLGYPGGWVTAGDMRSPLEIAAAGIGLTDEHLGVLRGELPEDKDE